MKTTDVLRILLPIILFIILGYIPEIISLEKIINFEIALYFYQPITFGLIIGLVFWKFFTSNPLINLCLGIGGCLVCYLIGYVGIFLIGDVENRITPLVSMFIVAPLLTFLLYGYLFKIPITRFTTTVIILTPVILIVYAYCLHTAPRNINQYLTNHKIFNALQMWQIVMAIAIGLLVNQKQIKRDNR